MGFNCGILGLPNIGKSTLFNALTSTQQAESKNYPFCTIEPNVGKVAVKDLRLDNLSKISNSQNKIYNQLEFVDIAGLVKGASKGEGLGNKFLGNLSNVDAIIHLVRCFEDNDITHVNNKVSPIEDIKVIETELLLSDLEKVERMIDGYLKKNKGKKVDQNFITTLENSRDTLENGILLRNSSFSESQEEVIKTINLLSYKPIIYVCNVDEDSLINGNQHSKQVETYSNEKNLDCMKISAKIESEISSFKLESEKTEFLESLGLRETSLSRLISKGYEILDLITFFTSGPKESRAWSIKKGTFAPDAGAKIHTDFKTGFIKAEVISYEDFVKFNGEVKCKENGRLKLEGKEYIVNDGDVITFRFNV
ncbi:MAG: redox-regulated ATPase YchF [Rickettsiales bacterium]|nr:redox-regulated ATPase YchF [Rickettsiales bacterium]OUT46212.1 MAG: redox-regulated ATPase YchF [Pelagibacteraceae bacterium TMED13]